MEHQKTISSLMVLIPNKHALGHQGRGEQLQVQGLYATKAAGEFGEGGGQQPAPK